MLTILNLVVLGFIKILDNMISTAKNIATYKNMKVLSSLLVIASQFIFYYIIDSISEGDTGVTIAVVSVCSGVGTYIAMLIGDKTQRDSVYTNILTCNSGDDIMELCDYLLSKDIKYIPIDSYNRDHSKSLTVLIFARSKKESSLIDAFVKESDVKYLRQVLK